MEIVKDTLNILENTSVTKRKFPTVYKYLNDFKLIILGVFDSLDQLKFYHQKCYYNFYGEWDLFSINPLMRTVVANNQTIFDNTVIIPGSINIGCISYNEGVGNSLRKVGNHNLGFEDGNQPDHLFNSEDLQLF